MNREDFARRFLDGVGAPPSDRNLEAVLSWMQGEYSYTFTGPKADNNPLNTTKSASGATNFNSVGVKNYVSAEQGVRATIDTLLSGARMAGDPYHYAPILEALRRNFRPRRTLRRVEKSAWGTGGLAKKVLRDVKANYTPYAIADIN